ncbi:MAG: FAD-binding protein [Planctomycetes bacterium]|nr:FAD-binding protein [Planctomycetota bacterium]
MLAAGAARAAPCGEEEAAVARKTTEVKIDGLRLKVHAVNTLVVGSGAAGLNAALQVFERGQPDVMILTEDWSAGTSRNAGSDKQTYYKLALAGAPDSPREMARDIARGGGMHGDIALCEAQHSAEAFFNLVRLGVPFPHDRFGAYVGYRTDHDPRGRGTSAGPLTSRLMCERLGDAVRARPIPVLDGHELIALLTASDADGRRRVAGVVALDRSRLDSGAFGLVLVSAVNVVLATGGPGGLYRTSVYPESQIGSFGPALAAGAIARNLTESQFGLGSVQVRWNVSGSYQQVIPSYVSTDRAGGDERAFLDPFFPDRAALAGAIFRKGYQWPFDAGKVAGHGSSLIDLLVFREIVHEGRRVFLDFTRNAGGAAFSLDCLDSEARTYLEKSRAAGATPIERLAAMNPAAIAFYRSHGIALERDRLEIAVCAQHLNGGLAANLWWESNLRHLFPIGEVSGTHGYRRPGGSSLNAGQVGGIRAALYITKRYADAPPDAATFRAQAAGPVRECLALARRVTERGGAGPCLGPDEAIAEIQERISAVAAHVRERGRVERAVPEAWALVRRIAAELGVAARTEVNRAFRAADLALTHAMFLEAIAEYLARGGKSRGSALVLDADGRPPVPELGDAWRYALNSPDAFVDRKILEVRLLGAGEVEKRWTDPRPVPEEDGWFEAVWSDYRNDRVIRGDE